MNEINDRSTYCGSPFDSSQEEPCVKANDQSGQESRSSRRSLSISSPVRVPGRSARRYAATERRGIGASTLTLTSTEMALGGRGASSRTDPSSMWAGIVKLSIGVALRRNATTTAGTGRTIVLRDGRHQRTGHGARFTGDLVRSIPSPSAPEPALTLGPTSAHDSLGRFTSNSRVGSTYTYPSTGNARPHAPSQISGGSRHAELQLRLERQQDVGERPCHDVERAQPDYAGGGELGDDELRARTGRRSDQEVEWRHHDSISVRRRLRDQRLDVDQVLQRRVRTHREERVDAVLAAHRSLGLCQRKHRQQRR